MKAWKLPFAGFLVGCGITLMGGLLTQQPATAVLGGATIGLALAFTGAALVLVSWLVIIAIWVLALFRRY